MTLERSKHALSQIAPLPVAVAVLASPISQHLSERFHRLGRHQVVAEFPAVMLGGFRYLRPIKIFLFFIVNLCTAPSAAPQRAQLQLFLHNLSVAVRKPRIVTRDALNRLEPVLLVKRHGFIVV